MKVIFLDLDGVLNSRKSFAFYTLTGKKRDSGSPDLHSVVLLDYLLFLKPEVKIVISSSRRDLMGFEQSRIDLRYEFGLMGWERVIGQTPFTRERHRGKEIDAWLKKNSVEKYVILDDDSDFLPYQRPYHIHTPNAEGFSPEHLEQTADLLGMNIDNLYIDANVLPFRQYYKIMKERELLND